MFQSYLLESVIPVNVVDKVDAILGEGETALYENGVWFGSLTELEGFKGYWFRTSEETELTFDFSDNSSVVASSSKVKEVSTLIGYDFTQSSSQAAYFVRELPEAKIGDYIIAYHNDVVIGKRQWNGKMVDIPVMGDDGESYSSLYINSGDIPVFKLYHTNTGEEELLYGDIQSFVKNEIYVMDVLSTDNYVLPNAVTLHGAYPNPFNPSTKIKFELPYAMHVELNILDIQGRLVKKVASNSYTEGVQEILVNGESLASGLYFAQLVTENSISYSKILLLK